MDEIKKTKIVSVACVIVVISLLLTFIIIVGVGVYRFVYRNDLERLSYDGYEILESCISPDGRYTVDIYRVSLSAVSKWGTLGVLTDNNTGGSRNIYFKYPEDIVINMEFEDNTTVYINGMGLDVRRDKYDSRLDSGSNDSSHK